MRTLVAIAATLACLTGALLARGVQVAGAKVCHEDKRCWNWRTMGHKQRGIETIGGRHLVVSPARFDRANRGGWIDWQSTRKMRGDGPRFDVQDY